MARAPSRCAAPAAGRWQAPRPPGNGRQRGGVPQIITAGPLRPQGRRLVAVRTCVKGRRGDTPWRPPSWAAAQTGACPCAKLAGGRVLSHRPVGQPPGPAQPSLGGLGNANRPRSGAGPRARLYGVSSSRVLAKPLGIVRSKPASSTRPATPLLRRACARARAGLRRRGCAAGGAPAHRSPLLARARAPGVGVPPLAQADRRAGRARRVRQRTVPLEVELTERWDSMHVLSALLSLDPVHERAERDQPGQPSPPEVEIETDSQVSFA